MLCFRVVHFYIFRWERYSCSSALRYSTTSTQHLLQIHIVNMVRNQTNQIALYAYTCLQWYVTQSQINIRIALTINYSIIWQHNRCDTLLSGYLNKWTHYSITIETYKVSQHQIFIFFVSNSETTPIIWNDQSIAASTVLGLLSYWMHLLIIW